MNLRRSVADFLGKYRWVPLVSVFATGLALTTALILHASLPLELGVAVALALTAYVWGYSAHRFKNILWPSLAHLPRRQYGDVWDSLAGSAKEATAATAGGASDEDVPNLLQLASVGARDEVLEIGCGVGRLGLGLAPHCRQWTGADISSKTLAYAADRLARLSNVRFVHLPGVGLDGLPHNSFDVAYSVDVFAHLDEIDRWRYVQDAFRVLRSGGRLYIDSIDLESESGWNMFANHARHWQSLERPPYDTRFSTAAELTAYANRAGFGEVRSHHRPPKVIVTAIKMDTGSSGSN